MCTPSTEMRQQIAECERQKFQPLLDAVVDLLRDQRRSEWWNDRISVDERHIADLEDACHALKIDWVLEK
jgi:hypothetical protein